MMIESVGVCNAKCTYCPQGRGLVKPDGPTFLGEDTLERALALARYGQQKGIYLHHRGEPFLHPALDYIVRRVRKAGFFAYLSSNLISITEEKLSRVLAAGLNDLRIHLSAALTVLPPKECLDRIAMLQRLNGEIRNHACRVEVTYGLASRERPEEVLSRLSGAGPVDVLGPIDFYEPHDWPQLAAQVDNGIDPRDCKWFQTRSCAILSDGRIVICCLDQFGFSSNTRVTEVERLRSEDISKRDLCRSCRQYAEMDYWLEAEALEVPEWLRVRVARDKWM